MFLLSYSKFQGFSPQKKYLSMSKTKIPRESDYGHASTCNFKLQVTLCFQQLEYLILKFCYGD